MNRVNGNQATRLKRLEKLLRPTQGKYSDLPPHVDENLHYDLHAKLSQFGWAFDALQECAGKTIPELSFSESHGLWALDVFHVWHTLTRVWGSLEALHAYQDQDELAFDYFVEELRGGMLADFGLVGDLSQRINSDDWGSWSCNRRNPAYVLDAALRGHVPCPRCQEWPPDFSCVSCGGSAWANADGSPRKVKHESIKR